MASKRPAIDRKENEIVRSDFWYWAVLVLVLIGAAVIRIRLLSIPLERDEGEYAYIAQQMLNSVPPYESAYSMKLPGIYVVYALIIAVFGQTQTGIHLGLIVFNAATIFVIFLLTRRLFGGLAAVMAAAVFAVTSLTRPVLGLSANAEHFVILPALIGVLLIAKAIERQKKLLVFIAAILLGLAFIIKQHGIFFSLFAAVYLLYSDLRLRPFRLAKVILNQLVFIAGAVLPFALVCLFYWRIGVFDKFWFWTFTYAGKYATMVPLSEVPEIFLMQFGRLAYSVIPAGLFALLGLVIILFSGRLRVHLFFILGLLVFSFLSVCPGFYFREHYFILLLPVIAVLAGMSISVFCDLMGGRGWGRRRVVVVALTGLIVIGYSLFNQRMYLFDGGGNEVCRRIYGANSFPESLEIAKYIRQNSLPTDTVAVLGSEPQIYFYSNRRAATSYIYVYPLTETHPYALQMQKEMIEQIENVRPKFLIMVNIGTSWLCSPTSNNFIFEWLNEFIQQNYVPVGVADIVALDHTIYSWGRQADDYNPKSKLWIAVYKLNPEPDIY